MVGFNSASLFPARKWEAVTQEGNQRDKPPDVEENPGSQYLQKLTAELKKEDEDSEKTFTFWRVRERIYKSATGRRRMWNDGREVMEAPFSDGDC